MKNPLSNDFKVACEIWYHQINGKKIWYAKLVTLLEGEISKNTITKTLDVLFDWDIVKAEYGGNDDEKPSKLLRISSGAEGIVSKLYEGYWKEYRKDHVREETV